MRVPRDKWAIDISRQEATKDTWLLQLLHSCAVATKCCKHLNDRKKKETKKKTKIGRRQQRRIYRGGESWAAGRRQETDTAMASPHQCVVYRRRTTTTTTPPANKSNPFPLPPRPEEVYSTSFILLYVPGTTKLLQSTISSPPTDFFFSKKSQSSAYVFEKFFFLTRKRSGSIFSSLDRAEVRALNLNPFFFPRDRLPPPSTGQRVRNNTSYKDWTDGANTQSKLQDNGGDFFFKRKKQNKWSFIFLIVLTWG